MTPDASNQFFDREFSTSPAMVILRGLAPDATFDLARRALELGCALVEVPLQSDEAAQGLLAVTAELEASRVGAGTITDRERVARAAECGASFTVAPGFDPAIAQASLDAGMPHLPGVATATEVHHALSFGFRWLKAFPASSLGADWFGAMRGPFPDVRFVATGGIDADNAGHFLSAGAAVVSLGGAVTRSPEALEVLTTLRSPA